MKGLKMNNIPTPSGYDVYWEKWVDAYSVEEDFSQLFNELETNQDEEEPHLSFEEQEQLQRALPNQSHLS